MKQPRKPGFKRHWMAAGLAATLGLGGFAGGDTASTYLQDAFNGNSAPAAAPSVASPAVKDIPAFAPIVDTTALQDKYNAVAAMPPTLLEAIIADDAVAMRTALAGSTWKLHDDNEAVLRLAAAFGSWNVAANALSLGADVHARNEAPLREAARHGDDSIVRMLVDRGADVHALNEYPLRIASAFGHAPVVAYLLERGAKPDQSMLNMAASVGDVAPEMKEKSKDVTNLLARALQKQATNP